MGWIKRAGGVVGAALLLLVLGVLALGIFVNSMAGAVAFILALPLVVWVLACVVFLPLAVMVWMMGTRKR